MRKIASPQDLQAELRSVMAYVHGYGPDGRPDRQVVASKLYDIADRVAASGPILKVKEVGAGGHYEMEISGTVGRIEVKGRVRRVSIGVDKITPQLVSEVITLNRVDGGKPVPPGAKRKVEQAVLKKLQELEKKK